jgi:hypothetical protein
MAKTKERISDVKPYVERAVKDEDLRENVMAAFQAAREVYNDLLGDRGVTGLASRVATDKDIQDNLRSAIEDLRKAADRVHGKKEHTTRNATLLLTGIVLGILFNPVTGPQTRGWLSDRLFGESDTSPGGSGNSGSGSGS